MWLEFATYEQFKTTVLEQRMSHTHILAVAGSNFSHSLAIIILLNIIKFLKPQNEINGLPGVGKFKPFERIPGISGNYSVDSGNNKHRGCLWKIGQCHRQLPFPGKSLFD